MKKKVFASLLSCNILRIEKEIEKIQVAGIKRLHIDIMDGVFTQNIFLGEEAVNRICKRFPEMEIECHLMVSNPMRVLENIDIENVKRVLVHTECCTQEIAAYVQKRKGCLGIAISPDQSINTSYVPENTDKILIMGVYPGAGGQKILSCTKDRVLETKKKYPGLLIGVDGGINTETIRDFLEADEFVLGSCLFKQDTSPKIVFDKINDIAE